MSTDGLLREPGMQLLDHLERVGAYQRPPEPGEIKARRELVGWSQVDLARELGLSPSSVFRWETGKSPMGRGMWRLVRLLVEMERLRLETRG